MMNDVDHHTHLSLQFFGQPMSAWGRFTVQGLVAGQFNSFRGTGGTDQDQLVLARTDC